MSDITSQPPYYNPLNLRIGQKVQVKSITTMEYNSKNVKSPKTHLMSGSEGVEMFITGAKKKASGEWTRGEDYGFGEYVPPYFKPLKYHWFYLAKKGIKDKEYLVAPQDLTVIKESL